MYESRGICARVTEVPWCRGERKPLVASYLSSSSSIYSTWSQTFILFIFYFFLKLRITVAERMERSSGTKPVCGFRQYYCICRCLTFSEAHPQLPGIGCQDLIFLPHDAGVRPLVDSVSHNTNVIILQGDVARVRELQQLAVFIPATESRVVKVSGWWIIGDLNWDQFISALIDWVTNEAKKKYYTHSTFPCFAAIFFPQRKVSFLPSATSFCLVRGGFGVGATVGKGNAVRA